VKRFLYLMQKEFRQIFRDRIILAMILIMPTMQLVLLPLAADFEVRNINIAIVDLDRSSMSTALTSRITSNAYFNLITFTNDRREAIRLIESNDVDVILEIPRHFERNLVRTDEQTLMVTANAINGMKANIGVVYLNRIIAEQNAQLRMQYAAHVRGQASPLIEVRNIDRFNPHLDNDLFMVPGILALLLTMIGVYLSSMNIVREKELGTIEQINVTPIRRLEFIAGKLVPFWILSMVVFTIGMLVTRFIYGIVPAGSVLLLYGFGAVYLTAILGLGLLISTISETQQQSMFVSFFFMMVFILLGGLFTSIDSMPVWAQALTYLNPVRYIIEVMRLVMLKGSGFHEIRFQFGVIAAMSLVLNTWAVLKYRKTS